MKYYNNIFTYIVYISALLITFCASHVVYANEDNTSLPFSDNKTLKTTTNPIDIKLKKLKPIEIKDIEPIELKVKNIQPLKIKVNDIAPVNLIISKIEPIEIPIKPLKPLNIQLKEFEPLTIAPIQILNQDTWYITSFKYGVPLIMALLAYMAFRSQKDAIKETSQRFDFSQANSLFHQLLNIYIQSIDKISLEYTPAGNSNKTRVYGEEALTKQMLLFKDKGKYRMLDILPFRGVHPSKQFYRTIITSCLTDDVLPEKEVKKFAEIIKNSSSPLQRTAILLAILQDNDNEALEIVKKYDLLNKSNCEVNCTLNLINQFEGDNEDQISKKYLEFIYADSLKETTNTEGNSTEALLSIVYKDKEELEKKSDYV